MATSRTRMVVVPADDETESDTAEQPDTATQIHDTQHQFSDSSAGWQDTASDSAGRNNGDTEFGATASPDEFLLLQA